MSDAQTVHTTMWIMIFLQTIGSVDMPTPGGGPRKMPAPRAYVAIIVLWTILGIWADSTNSRGPRRFAWLLVLSGIVLGPFGKRLVGFLESVATGFGVGQTAQPSSTAPAPRRPPTNVSTPPVRPRVTI